MGMYSGVEFVYGVKLDEDEVYDFMEKDHDDEFMSDVVEKFCEDNGFQYAIGGDYGYGEEYDYVIGFPLGGFHGVGAHALNDNFGKVDDSVIEKVKFLVEKFGREAKRYAVINYG